MDIDINNIRQLDHGLLLVFMELVRQRKTTSAAERLGLSQSAVSHSLARLRVLFGDPLFVRRPDGLQPTAHTLALMPLVEDILQKSQQLLTFGQDFSPLTTSRVFRVAANDLVSNLYGIKLVETLRDLAPRARITFQFAVGKEAIEALRTDEVDLAIGRFYGLPAGFHAETLSEEHFVLAARHDHPELAESPNIETFVRLDHALVSFRGHFTGPVDEALAADGQSRRVVASFPLYMSALCLVACSDVVATLPERLVQLHAARFGLRLHPLPIRVDPFPLIVVQHDSTRSDPAITWLKRVLSDLPDRFR